MTAEQIWANAAFGTLADNASAGASEVIVNLGEGSGDFPNPSGSEQFSIAINPSLNTLAQNTTTEWNEVTAVSGSGPFTFTLSQPLTNAHIGGEQILHDITADALGNLGGGGSGVTSFNSRTGSVSPESGDYTVGEVTGAAPLASPTLTGTPTAPTAIALTEDTQIATTAYTDSAVGVETSRAETAEALLMPSLTVASESANFTASASHFYEVNASSGDVTVTPPTNVSGVIWVAKKADPSTNTVTISATVDGTANPVLKYQYGTLYMIGDGSTWQRMDRHTLESLVDVSAASPSTSQALAWNGADWVPESFLLLTGGTMSGDIAMGSNKITGLANGSASSDAAAFGQIPVVGGSSVVLNGSTSGTATLYPIMVSVPNTGGYIKYMVVLAAFDDSGGHSITYPSAFTNDVPGWMATPAVGAYFPSTTKTAMTFPATSGVSGVIIIEGS